MKISEYSSRRVREGAAHWEVLRDFYDPLFNYLIYGYNPGSFFTSVLANDFFMAIQRSHPSNTIDSFKKTTGWIQNRFPRCTWGDYKKVNDWVTMTDEKRRKILEDYAVIYTEQEEIMLALKGTELGEEPFLW